MRRYCYSLKKKTTEGIALEHSLAVPPSTKYPFPNLLNFTRLCHVGDCPELTIIKIFNFLRIALSLFVAFFCKNLAHENITVGKPLKTNHTFNLKLKCTCSEILPDLEISGRQCVIETKHNFCSILLL